MRSLITPPDASAHPPGAFVHGRRRFLHLVTGGAALLLAAGCDSNNTDEDDDGTAPMVNLGTGDVAVLNYAYALEQLEAAFYTRATGSFFNGATEAERQILTDLRDHEVSHREFLKAALGDDAIPALTIDFEDIDFGAGGEVLGNAFVLEDLGVGAYNGAAALFQNPDLLAIAGKIVSVEARHASVIRSLLIPNSPAFAGDDVIDPDTGLGRALSPSVVLAAAASFIVNPIDASGLPTA